MPIGRVTQVVDCREAMGMGKGGAIAQRGTISECRYPDVIVVGMSPGRRHVTKPVCDITSGLRQQGVEYSISTLVLYAGSGVPPDAPKLAGGVLGSSMGLTDKEIVQIEKHKVAILHHGNVRSHVVQKVRFILQACDVKAVVVSQAPIDFEDFAKEGVKTTVVMPPADKIRTKGTVMAIVSGVPGSDPDTREDGGSHFVSNENCEKEGNIGVIK
jgi:methyl-coenzyme M reductase subunit C